jgi:hypothetical protein
MERRGEHEEEEPECKGHAQEQSPSHRGACESSSFIGTESIILAVEVPVLELYQRTTNLKPTPLQSMLSG